MALLLLINKVAAVLIILGQVAILLLLSHLFLYRKQNRVFAFVKKNGLVLAFIVALFSFADSIFYSQVAGFAPCQLCWWQRIFMYPLTVILAVALLKKPLRARGDFGVVDYALSLAIVGAAISVYHNYVYFYNGGLSATCQVLGGSVSCFQKYVSEFGYVTIPVMALTAFTLIITCLIFSKFKQHD